MKNLILIIATLFNFSLVAQVKPVSTVVIPKQTGNAGKYLKTDGNKMDWATVPTPTYAPGVSAALTGSGTVGFLPMYSSANTFTNSEILQTGAGFGSTVTVAGVPFKNNSIDMTGNNNYYPGEIKALSLFGDAIRVTNYGSLNCSTGDLNIQTNNYATLFGGSVGIGTASPLTKLDVNGSYSFGGYGGSYSNFTKFGLGGYSGNTYYENGTFVGSTFLYSDRKDETYDVFRFLNKAGTENVRFLSNGNVGIGVSSPTANLQVNRANDGVPLISATSGGYEIFSTKLGAFNTLANKHTFDGFAGGEYTFIADANPTLYFETRSIGPTLTIGGSLPTFETFRPVMYIHSPLLGIGTFSAYTDVTAKVQIKPSGTEPPLRLEGLPIYSAGLASGTIFKYADAGSPSGFSTGVMP